MRTIKLMVTALDPLVITNGTTEGMSHETLNYIPGNMLLGAFAKKWRQSHPEITHNADGNIEFKELFLGGTEWGHAYPSDDAWNQSLPIPLSFQKIKGYEGIPCATESTENVFVVNMLSSERKRDELAELLNNELKNSGKQGDVKEVKLKKEAPKKTTKSVKSTAKTAVKQTDTKASVLTPSNQVMEQIVYQKSAQVLDRDAKDNETFGVGDAMPVYFY